MKVSRGYCEYLKNDEEEYSVQQVLNEVKQKNMNTILRIIEQKHWSEDYIYEPLMGITLLGANSWSNRFCIKLMLNRVLSKASQCGYSD